ncbi:hypothetical protein K1719_044743 [Acacia pycnantha]|nr:hypothetical protein K1719_044743 [Acacia pycnantha]
MKSRPAISEKTNKGSAGIWQVVSKGSVKLSDDVLLTITMQPSLVLGWFLSREAISGSGGLTNAPTMDQHGVKTSVHEIGGGQYVDSIMIENHAHNNLRLGSTSGREEEELTFANGVPFGTVEKARDQGIYSREPMDSTEDNGSPMKNGGVKKRGRPLGSGKAKVKVGISGKVSQVHGILNGIGWGIMMPTGAIMGRYLKTMEATGSTWFRLHRACQILAYIIGTIGFTLGIFLSSPSLSSLSPYGFVHASIGIAVFVSATVQVLAAIFLRPDKHHKARIFWNIFHYVLGYGVICLSIFNMFRGFSFSNSSHSWKNAYFGVIVSLGFVALILEAITWFFFCKRRNKKKMDLKETSADDNIPSQEIV